MSNNYVKYKNALSFIFSILLAPFIFIVILILIPIIILDSRGNPIYIQERVGLNGRRFNLYKLRTMTVDAEKEGAQWAEKNDTRVTKVGKFLRRTRLDELPQIFNIIKRDMNFVGPRPERPIFIEEFLKTIPDFNDRLAIKPGITGLAQVKGGYDLTPKEKLVYDKEYIEKVSLKLDIIILIKTIRTVLTGEGSR